MSIDWAFVFLMQAAAVNFDLWQLQWTEISAPVLRGTWDDGVNCSSSSFCCSSSCYSSSASSVAVVVLVSREVKTSSIRVVDQTVVRGTLVWGGTCRLLLLRLLWRGRRFSLLLLFFTAQVNILATSSSCRVLSSDHREPACTSGFFFCTTQMRRSRQSCSETSITKSLSTKTIPSQLPVSLRKQNSQTTSPHLPLSCSSRSPQQQTNKPPHPPPPLQVFSKRTKQKE